MLVPAKFFLNPYISGGLKIVTILLVVGCCFINKIKNSSNKCIVIIELVNCDASHEDIICRVFIFKTN